jgi:hypothetical protein
LYAEYGPAQFSTTRAPATISFTAAASPRSQQTTRGPLAREAFSRAWAVAAKLTGLAQNVQASQNFD